MTQTQQTPKEPAKSAATMNLILGIFLFVAGIVFIALHFSVAPLVGPALGIIMLIAGAAFIRKRNQRLR